MRLNFERQKELEPKRMAYAYDIIKVLTDCDILETTENKIVFMFKNQRVTLYPYSGYFNGKSVHAGRGIDYLLQQLTKK